MEFWICMASVAFGCLLLLFWLWPSVKVQSGKKLPPGPPCWPLIGSLFYLRTNLHRLFVEWKTTYGPIVHFRLGNKSFIVLSSPELAEYVLKKKDPQFCCRPITSSFYTHRKYFGFGNNDIVFEPYSQSVKLQKSVAVTGLHATMRTERAEQIRKEARAAAMMQISTESKSVTIGVVFQGLVEDFSYRSIFGTDYSIEDEEFNEIKHLIKAMEGGVGKIYLEDYYGHALSWVDWIRGTSSKRQKTGDKIVQWFAKLLQTRGGKYTGKINDFVDFTLSRKSDTNLSDISLMGLLHDMLVGSTQTAIATTEWALVELTRHPDIQAKLQKEIDTVIGTDRSLEESDIVKCSYLQAVTKEILRLHMPATLVVRLIPEETTIAGYHIPKDTGVMINAWGLARDPSFWEEPEKFKPERFLGDEPGPSVWGSQFHYIPFGHGRRQCPGVAYGLLAVHANIAALVHAFDWAPPSGMKPTDICSTESFGLVCRPVNSVRLVASSRPALKSYLPSSNSPKV